MWNHPLCILYMHIGESKTSIFFRILWKYCIFSLYYSAMVLLSNVSFSKFFPFQSNAFWNWACEIFHHGALCHDLNIFSRIFPFEIEYFSLTTFPSTNTSLSTTQYLNGMIDTVSKITNRITQMSICFDAIKEIDSLIWGNEQKKRMLKPMKSNHLVAVNWHLAFCCSMKP